MKKKDIKDAVINFRITTAQKEKINYDAQKVGLNVTEYLSAMAEYGRIIQVVKGKELIGMIYDINNDINELERCPIFSYQMIREVITKRLNSTLENIRKEKRDE